MDYMCNTMQYHIIIRIYYVGNTETGPKGMVSLVAWRSDEVPTMQRPLVVETSLEYWGWQPRTVALEGRGHLIPTELLGHVLLLRYFFWPTNDCKQGQYSSGWWYTYPSEK